MAGEPSLKRRARHDRPGRLFQNRYPLDVSFDLRVSGLAVVEAVVNLLDDHGQTEQTEAVVKIEVVHVHPGDFTIQLNEFPAGQGAVYVGGHGAHNVARFGVVLLDPVAQGATQVHERVADGAHFPVQDTDDSERVGGVQDNVVQFEVIMDDAGTLGFRGNIGFQPGHDSFAVRDIGGACRSKAFAPSQDLATDITVGLAQIRQPDGGGVQGVQFTISADKDFIQASHLVLGRKEALGKIFAQDDAFQMFHHVKRCAGYRGITAKGQGARCKGPMPVEGRQDFVFAAHVVGRGGLGAEGRPAQNEPAVVKGQQVSQIGCAAGILPDLRGPFKACKDVL